MRQLSLFDFLPGSAGAPAETGLNFVLRRNGKAIKTSKKEKNLYETGKNKQHTKSYSDLLFGHLPEESLEEVCRILAKHKVLVKITRKRYSKLGDYRSPQKKYGHRITINGNLNKYSFLITIVHELAHLYTWKKHRRRVKPHGKEWKHEFREMMQPIVLQKNFPEEIMQALNNYLKNPAASTCTDTRLLKTLKEFDIKKEDENIIHLEDVLENTMFSIPGSSKKFIKGKKLRKRFLCREVSSKRKYLVSPVAEIMILES